ncbi:hypothetical protein SAMD00023353_0302810 [Rosellinia necatrix]|uniref:Uncharacterized protein n=1 Tax=Rosellinia necatrix TaxID=77044 RepID=A0A1W2TDS3_ROSNE|nr:hypothetical protein SAMD00023353_0302810 [Rosellinia necatrix]
MIPSSEPSRLTRRDAKFDRIEIWRNEVAASPICCVCSAPSSASARSPTAGLYKSLVKLASSLTTDREEDPAVPSTTSASDGSNSSHARERRRSRDCTTCASPLDGVAYKRLGADGSGLVRARDVSAPSLASINCLEAGGKAKGGKKSLLKKVSQVFRRAKWLEWSQSNKSTELADTQQTTQTTHPNTLDDPITTTAGPCSRIAQRPVGTEMYHSLRPGTGSGDVAGDDGEDEIVDAVSDGDDKKPKVGIDESAARLRRAQKLLNMGH